MTVKASQVSRDAKPLSDASSLATTPGLSRQHHYPALDGLRGLAFLSVFMAHFYTMVRPASFWAWGGWLGVDLFFVLSGFLITGILYDSLGRPHFFRNFYIRRTLRIFPLYYSTWIVFLLLTPWLHPLWTRFDIANVFYFGNLMDFSAARHPEINPTGFMFYFGRHLTGFNTGALWSLCLEEQFYLIWPLLVFLLRDRRRIMTACAIGIPASLAWNIWLTLWALRAHVNRIFLYNATYAHFSPLLFGAWLALWLRGRAAGKPVAPTVYLSLILAPAIVLFGSLIFIVRSFDIVNPIVPTYGYICSGLMSSGIVLAGIQQDGMIKRVFSWRPLISIGVISYGLYIFHGFLMGASRHHIDAFQRHHVPLLMPLAAFLLTFAMASVSYRFLELPFLRLKDRFAPTRPVSVTGRDPSAPPREDADPITEPAT